MAASLAQFPAARSYRGVWACAAEPTIGCETFFRCSLSRAKGKASRWIAPNNPEVNDLEVEENLPVDDNILDHYFPPG
ncbi:hypothetical protein E2C01_066949 [Portunus trituberculatus]|uniref:Uncharacterized protein n=1 Tax=Portunus trituberculatus TaxID=210409 RepID=A0A5B7HTR6_PORTR|nr:hypothetical protein [Portunus trituberculatus]